VLAVEQLYQQQQQQQQQQQHESLKSRSSSLFGLARRLCLPHQTSHRWGGLSVSSVSMPSHPIPFRLFFIQQVQRPRAGGGAHGDGGRHAGGAGACAVGRRPPHATTRNATVTNTAATTVYVCVCCVCVFVCVCL
jgi:hypothetical protein